MLKDVEKALEEYLSRRPQDRAYLTGYFERHPEHKAEMVEQLLLNEAMHEEQRRNPPKRGALTPEEKAKRDAALRRWEQMIFE